MPLRRRLLALIALVLALCLVAAGGLTYLHGTRKIELEMSSAIEVGASSVSDALSAMPQGAETPAYILRILRSFDADRHVVAKLITPDGKTLNSSNLKAPVDPAPAWLYRMFAGTPHIRLFELPTSLQYMGALRIEADPHNEIGEVWEDLKLKFVIVSGFCVVVLGLIYATLGWALRPLEKLSIALQQVGAGDYSAHVPESGPDDLKLIYRAFNGMADQLQDAESQNRRLNEQLSTVQEEERAEIARDLHDEIGPFLFAVDVDAQSIPLLLSKKAEDDVLSRSKAIRQSVQHMQLHLRSVLGRLRPALLIDQGLIHAVEQLIAFWQARRPQITFKMDIDDARYPAKIEEVAFRVLQEGVSNAVRHGNPSNISLFSNLTDAGALRVGVWDDGTGLVKTTTDRRGFGLAGMRERVTALGGTLRVTDRRPESGCVLIVEIPVSAARRPDERDQNARPSAA